VNEEKERSPLGKNSLAVGIGGIVGALARYGLALLGNPADPAAFPWGTLLCNLAGCLLLGWLASLAEGRLPPRLKLGLTTGVIGAFTTFSTFSLELVSLLQHGRLFSALVYALVSAAGGLLLTRAGMGLAAPGRKSA
jgi:CrcB protein